MKSPRLLFFYLLAVTSLFAYRPASDTAGPITARIEGPEQITRIGEPERLAVAIENTGDAAVTGTIHVHGIDRWGIKPVGPVAFSVGAKATTRLDFSVVAAEGTFQAFYPIHAIAEFEWQGRRWQAHPILVVRALPPNSPRPEFPPGLKRPALAVRSLGASPPPVFPPLGSPRLLGSIKGFEVRVWPGQRGLLDATFGFRDGAKNLYFRGYRARVLGSSLENADSPNHLIGAREEPAGGRYRIRHRFRSWAGTFDLVTETWIEKGALRTSLSIENTLPQPWVNVHLEDVCAGSWSERAVRVYAGPGNVMQDPQAFRLQANGHFLATSYVGLDFASGISMLQGVDVPADHLGVDPGVNSYSLHTPHNQVVSFIPTGNVWAAAKVFRDLNAPHAASGVVRLAGRFVLDLWGGRYAENAAALRKAFRYGMTDAVVIWHDWQRWGYDYRLPDIYPPGPQGGTVEEFRDLAAICRNSGVLFAPHDNYMDFYPDAEGFTYDNIAFTAERTPQTAWLNRSANAQSYHPRSDRILPFVERNIKLIKDGFAPGAYFIDVWSSEPPYDYYTSNGQFFDRVYTRDVWRRAFAWIREYLGGAPQISEAGADQYIGWLDGGTAAQMRVVAPKEPGGPVWRIETSDHERVPWFDIAYHDVFALHGAGYTGRYASGQDPRAHGMYSDDYIVTEVMTGHPGMASEAFGREPVRKYWLMHDVMRGLALRRMESFAFAGNNLHRQEIVWDNGGKVWANRSAENWTASEHDLPQYGFYARIPGKDGLLEAAIEKREGVIVEWSRSPAMLYVNARPVVFDTVTPQEYVVAGRTDLGPDPRPARMNPEARVVTFGAVSTNGALRVADAGDALELTPVPFSPAFKVSIRWHDLLWKLNAPKEVEALDESGRVLRRMPVERSGEEIRLTCESDVFSYRLR